MNTPTSTRKLRPQPSLAHLTDAERGQIADWTHTQTYEKVLDRVARPRSEGGFDLKVSISVLQRLRDRTAHHRLISDQLEDKLQLTELLALENGEPVPWSRGTHQLVQRAAFKIALLPDHTPARLLSLNRIADHPRRVEMDEHRKHIANEKLAIQKSYLALAEKRAAKPAEPANEPQSDHLGPLALNWDDVSERARIGMGLSKEEWARRDALHDLYDEDGNLKNPGQEAPISDLNPFVVPPLGGPSSTDNHTSHTSPHSHSSPATSSPPIADHSITDHSPVSAAVGSENSQSNPSAASPNLQSAISELQSKVESYTVARAREYAAYRRHISYLPRLAPVPEYITHHKHCPCGNASPCPTHEDGEFRPFPEWFWTLSPHDTRYANHLIDRGLPYRDPTEFLA